MNALKAARSHFRNFQERTREPGLTALLMIEVSLIFIAMPLAGMGAIPELVVPIMFVLLVIAILVVTSRSHVAAGFVVRSGPSFAPSIPRCSQTASARPVACSRSGR